MPSDHYPMISKTSSHRFARDQRYTQSPALRNDRPRRSYNPYTKFKMMRTLVAGSKRAGSTRVMSQINMLMIFAILASLSRTVYGVRAPNSVRCNLCKPGILCPYCGGTFQVQCTQTDCWDEYIESSEESTSANFGYSGERQPAGHYSNCPIYKYEYFYNIHVAARRERVNQQRIRQEQELYNAQQIRQRQHAQERRREEQRKMIQLWKQRCKLCDGEGKILEYVCTNTNCPTRGHVLKCSTKGNLRKYTMRCLDCNGKGNITNPNSSRQETCPKCLPDGWKEYTDENGNPYYANEFSGASQWERPSPGNGKIYSLLKILPVEQPDLNRGDPENDQKEDPVDPCPGYANQGPGHPVWKWKPHTCPVCQSLRIRQPRPSPVNVCPAHQYETDKLQAGASILSHWWTQNDTKSKSTDQVTVTHVNENKTINIMLDDGTFQKQIPRLWVREWWFQCNDDCYKVCPSCLGTRVQRQRSDRSPLQSTSSSRNVNT